MRRLVTREHVMSPVTCHLSGCHLSAVTSCVKLLLFAFLRSALNTSLLHSESFHVLVSCDPLAFQYFLRWPPGSRLPSSTSESSQVGLLLYSPSGPTRLTLSRLLLPCCMSPLQLPRICFPGILPRPLGLLVFSKNASSLVVCKGHFVLCRSIVSALPFR